MGPLPTAAVLPEDDARALLRAYPGDGLEAWLADQAWHATADGSWVVEAAHDGWTFRVEGVPGQTLRIVSRGPHAGAVTSWVVAP